MTLQEDYFLSELIVFHSSVLQSTIAGFLEDLEDAKKIHASNVQREENTRNKLVQQRLKSKSQRKA